MLWKYQPKNLSGEGSGIVKVLEEWIEQLKANSEDTQFRLFEEHLMSTWLQEEGIEAQKATKGQTHKVPLPFKFAHTLSLQWEAKVAYLKAQLEGQTFWGVSNSMNL